MGVTPTPTQLANIRGLRRWIRSIPKNMFSLLTRLHVDIHLVDNWQPFHSGTKESWSAAEGPEQVADLIWMSRAIQKHITSLTHIACTVYQAQVDPFYLGRPSDWYEPNFLALQTMLRRLFENTQVQQVEMKFITSEKATQLADEMIPANLLDNSTVSVSTMSHSVYQENCFAFTVVFVRE